MRDGLGAYRHPAYGDVAAPSFAIVPAGNEHPFLAPDAPAELRREANDYYREHHLSRINRRTALFLDAVPTARVVELDTSNHTIFVAREAPTAEAIFDFLG
jgi:hypothetical protein